jgi:hypothetical protein
VLPADPRGPGLTSLIAAGSEGNGIAAEVGGEVVAVGGEVTNLSRTQQVRKPT